MNRLIHWIERVAGVLLGLVTVLIVVSAIGRYLLARPVPDAFDLSRLLLGVAIIWGLAGLGYWGSHIKVDLLASLLGPRAKRAVNALAWTVLFGFTALLAWKIWGRVLKAMSGGDATMDLRLPHWPFFAVIWLGLAAALITTLWRLWLVVVRGRDLAEFEDVETALAADEETPA